MGAKHAHMPLVWCVSKIAHITCLWHIYSLGSLLNRLLGVLCVFTCLRAHVLGVITCSRACVLGVPSCLVCLTCLACLVCMRAYVLGVLACVRACFNEMFYFLTFLRTWCAFLSYLFYISILKFNNSYSKKFVYFVKLNIFLICILIPTYKTIWNQF